MAGRWVARQRGAASRVFCRVHLHINHTLDFHPLIIDYYIDIEKKKKKKTTKKTKKKEKRNGEVDDDEFNLEFEIDGT